MIDSSPRPLPRQRLEQLLLGLRERQGSSALKIESEVQFLRQQLEESKKRYSSATSSESHNHTQLVDEHTSEWDEAQQSRWDDAELRSYKAVFETAEREGYLRKTARKNIEHVTTELKNRGIEIEKQFMKAKDVPINRLTAFRNHVRQHRDRIESIELTVKTALMQRSLSVSANLTALPLPELTDANSALQAAQATIAALQSHADKLTNNPLAKFFESLVWWIICGLVFATTAAGLALASVAALPFALLISAGVTVVLVLVGLVGIRPWLKRSAQAEFPKMKQQSELANRILTRSEQLASEENDRELKRLAAKRDAKFEEAKQWRDEQVHQTTSKLEADLQQLKEVAQREKTLARDYLTDALEAVDGQYRLQIDKDCAAHAETLNRLASELSEEQQAIQSRMEEVHRGGTVRGSIGSQKAIQIFSRSRRWCVEHFKPWSQLVDANIEWPQPLEDPILPIGQVPLHDVFAQQTKIDAGNAQLYAPFLYSALEDGYLVLHGDPSKAIVKNLIRNFTMRALTSWPAGKTQVCVIDPPGLGQDYGWLMHLSDFDPALVTHRVWTQPAHIARQLSVLALNAEDFIQQSLRNQFHNIAEYNREAAALAEPYRIVIWSNFPSGLDEQSWKNLQSLLDSGARCGIFPILIIGKGSEFSSTQVRDNIMQRGLHLTVAEDGESLRADSGKVKDMNILVDSSLSDEMADRLIHQVGERALRASRIEVPLTTMLPSREERWQADSSRILDIPIGSSGIGRSHSLKLGAGTAQHAIIAGKTGSGKSSLLHAMITSAVAKYSPQQLRIVLLDFKKGVEFQVYSDARLPHADIIGIESHREFGLSALEHIDSCLHRRGEAFRKGGVQDIASWNAQNPNHTMPRMLLIVDEFQELFVEDDQLSAKASLILDRIVRQGRSFGVHAVMSSQTLAGSYSLPRTTLGQMAVRIALQCDAADAQIIFSEDNPAATRLKHPGQAVYNDAGGRIEGNQPMQIGWLSKSDQEQILHDFAPGYQNDDPTTNLLGRTVIYDGNRPAIWNDRDSTMAIEHCLRDVNKDATWCVVGESVAISPPVALPLTSQPGRNILLVTGEDTQAAAVANSVVASYLRQSLGRNSTARLSVIQGAKPTDAHALALPARWAAWPCTLQVADTRGLEKILKDAHADLQARMDASDAGQFEPHLIQLLQLGRLRNLRKEDDFSLGSFGEQAEASPDKLLEDLLKDGPSYGIHTMIWADSFTTVNRWLSRQALREMEVRILTQMSANDSTNLIDSVAASRLGDHVMLLFDEATGLESRFRPYDNDSFGDLTHWVTQ